MDWYVSFGEEQAFHAPVFPSGGGGWQAQRFPSERAAIQFAIERIEAGLHIQAVGRMDDGGKPRYRHADIVEIRRKQPG
jgi:hypothetical protein